MRHLFLRLDVFVDDFAFPHYVTAPFREPSVVPPVATSAGIGLGIEMARRSKPRLFTLDEQKNVIVLTMLLYDAERILRRGHYRRCVE